MKKILMAGLIITVFAACKDKKDTGTTTTVADSITATNNNTPVEAAPDPARDSAAIRNVVSSFYNWYGANYQRLMGFNLYSSIRKKDMPPYKINWDEVQKLQDYIRSSVPQLGNEFLDNQKRMLQEADSAFKVDVTDEIPYGFDYDWYTNSQEDAQYTVDAITKTGKWDIAINGDKARVAIKGADLFELKLAMNRENGTWKIAKIGVE